MRNICVILTIMSFLTLLFDRVEPMAIAYLVFLICLLLIKNISQKTLQLYSVWIIGFVYVILGEMLLGADYQASRLLLAANSTVLLGYELLNFRVKKPGSPTILHCKTPAKPFLFLLCLEVIYILLSYKRALLTMAVGRYAAYGLTAYDNPLLEGLLGASEMILPSLYVFYYRSIKRQSNWLAWSLFFSLPIFLLIFMKGSRFYLLFSLLGFLIVSGIIPLFNVRLKSLRNLSIIVILVAFAAMSMKNMRTIADSDIAESNFETKDLSLAHKIGQYTSPEGVVDMTSLSMDYFRIHSHTMGIQTANIFYFWIPRSIWPDKPTMIGHWLIRTSETGFAEGHSGSFGFCGELFADFGYFMFLLLPFIGGGIKLGDKTIKRNFKVGEYRTILYSMLYPYVFFIIRSPITGTIAFFSILFIYYLFKKLAIQ